jgi:hypothetical protein
MEDDDALAVPDGRLSGQREGTSRQRCDLVAQQPAGPHRAHPTPPRRHAFGQVKDAQDAPRAATTGRTRRQAANGEDELGEPLLPAAHRGINARWHGVDDLPS